MAWSEWKKFGGGVTDIPYELGLYIRGFTSSTGTYEQYLPCSGYKYAKLTQANITATVYPITIVDGVKKQGQSLGTINITQKVIEIPDGTVALYITGSKSQNWNSTRYGLYTSQP